MRTTPQELMMNGFYELSRGALTDVHMWMHVCALCNGPGQGSANFAKGQIVIV